MDRKLKYQIVLFSGALRGEEGSPGEGDYAGLVGSWGRKEAAGPAPAQLGMCSWAARSGPRGAELVDGRAHGGCWCTTEFPSVGPSGK